MNLHRSPGKTGTLFTLSSYLIQFGKRQTKKGKRGTEKGSYLFWFLLYRTKKGSYLFTLGKRGNKVGSTLFRCDKDRKEKGKLRISFAGRAKNTNGYLGVAGVGKVAGVG